MNNDSKQTELIKMNQTEILELKSTITEIKNSLELFNNGSEQAEGSMNLKISMKRNEHFHMQNNEVRPNLTLQKKVSSKWIKYLN